MTDTPSKPARSNGHTPDSQCAAKAAGGTLTTHEKIRVFVAAEHRLLHDALTRLLSRSGCIEVVGTDSGAALPTALLNADVDVLLLTSRGNLQEDLSAVQQVHAALSAVRILLLGMAGDEREFLQCVRAGISGYLQVDASSDEVLHAVQAVYAGAAVCPDTLCSVLFRYFESDAASLPCASSLRRLGLSRRELQLIPLIAKGLTNKEIASHFSLSEQTVKNHLYRMKHKIGAGDRLEMVQLYRTQGFLA